MNSNNNSVVGLVCLSCGSTYDLEPIFSGCPICRTDSFRSNLTVQYDYDELKKIISRKSFSNNRPGIWRFSDLLPIIDSSHFLSIGEGNTPLVPLPRVSEEAKIKHVFAKNEICNPTLSYKDRFCAVATAKALDFGAKATTAASTGNLGASSAAYATRAGLDCFLFTVTYTSDSMRTLMGVYGAKLVATKVSEDRWTLMKEGIERYGWYSMGSYTIPPTGNPYGVEGYKTISFEIAEQMEWKVPDLVIVPTAFAEGLFGCWKGFKEAKYLGLTESLPRMIAAMPEGCDPLRVAIEQKLDKLPILGKKDTIAISIGTYTTGHQGLVALRESNGGALSVSDDEILTAQRILSMDGIFAEPASAASVAAVIKLGRLEKIAPEASVVCVITSSGLKMLDIAQSYVPKFPVIDSGDFESYKKQIQSAYNICI